MRLIGPPEPGIKILVEIAFVRVPHALNAGGPAHGIHWAGPAAREMSGDEAPLLLLPVLPGVLEPPEVEAGKTAAVRVRLLEFPVHAVGLPELVVPVHGHLQLPEKAEEPRVDDAPLHIVLNEAAKELFVLGKDGIHVLMGQHEPWFLSGGHMGDVREERQRPADDFLLFGEPPEDGLHVRVPVVKGAGHPEPRILQKVRKRVEAPAVHFRPVIADAHQEPVCVEEGKKLPDPHAVRGDGIIGRRKGGHHLPYILKVKGWLAPDEPDAVKLLPFQEGQEFIRHPVLSLFRLPVAVGTIQIAFAPQVDGHAFHSLPPMVKR